MEGVEPADAVVVLTNEVHELKTCITILKEENRALKESFNQLLIKNDSLEKYIVSLEAAKPSSPETSRKCAKKFQQDSLNQINIRSQSEVSNNAISDITNNILVNSQPIANITPVLADINSNNNNIPGISSSSNIRAIASNNTNNSNCTNSNSVYKNNKKKIIQVIDTDLSTVKQKIKSTNCNDFTLHQKNNKGPIKIAITNNSEIPKIKESLTINKLSFHEFKWQEEKSKCFVLRGLIGATIDDIPYIKQELVGAGLPNSITLVPLHTGYMRAHPGVSHNTLFKLVVPPGFDDKVLLGIKYIDHVAVKFEKLKSNRVMQCKNCQRFGHSAGGCQHPHRCVKCGANHYRNDCPRTHNKAVKLKCCNCGGEHTANNVLECQYFIQRYGTGNEPANTTSDVPIDKKIQSGSNNTNSVTPGQTYAHVTSRSHNNGEPSNNRNAQNSINKAKSNGSIHIQSSTSIENKVDQLIQLVSCHGAMLQKLMNDG